MLLERELLSPTVRADSSRVAAILHPDFEEIGSSGRLWSRDAIVNELAGQELRTRRLRGSRDATLAHGCDPADRADVRLARVGPAQLALASSSTGAGACGSTRERPRPDRRCVARPDQSPRARAPDAAVPSAASESAVDLARPERSAVEERRVALHERGACGEAFRDIVGRLDAARRRSRTVRRGTIERMRRSTSSDRAASGAPESPPAPAASTTAGSVRRPSREIVVFVAMMPSSPIRTTSPAIFSTWSSVRSGAIFTRSGTPAGLGFDRGRAAVPAVRAPAGRAGPACWVS